MDLRFVISLETDDRADTLEVRDRIIDALEAVGLHLVMTDCGLDVYMSDAASLEDRLKITARVLFGS